jgi:hypothetical protein
MALTRFVWGTQRRHRMRVLALVSAVLLLAACDFVETFQEVQSQAEAAATLLEKDVGTRPFMGWNVNNGKFTNLNVVFDGTKVAAMTVRDLESKVRKAVGSSFKEQPQQLTVSARWEQ